jgi:hypothetical protein
MFYELSVPVGDVPCMRGRHRSQKRLCHPHVVTVQLQFRNRLLLERDILRQTLGQTFGLLQTELDTGAVHAQVSPRVGASNADSIDPAPAFVSFAKRPIGRTSSAT